MAWRGIKPKDDPILMQGHGQLSSQALAHVKVAAEPQGVLKACVGNLWRCATFTDL